MGTPMPTTLPERKTTEASREPGATAGGGGLTALLVPPVGLAVLSASVPPVLLLPATGVLLLMLGFGLALLAWLRQQITGRLPADDYVMAGGLVFLAFAASALADGPAALHAVETFVAGSTSVPSSARIATP